MRVVVNIICATFVLLFASSAMAQTNTPPKISVHVISIYAGTSGGGIDSSLQPLRGQLKRGFQNYSSFKKEGESTLSISLNQTQRTPLANGSAVALTYLAKEGTYVKLKFEIPGKVSTTLRVARGSTFFQAGLAYKEGILILAIEVD